MPVIVIGADTAVGEAAVEKIVPAAAEVRAFISDLQQADTLRSHGVKVAIGDVSDSSHVEAAALNCFCAVLVAEAATDGRERSFASDAQAVWEGWAAAVRNAGVNRTIWVSTQAEHAGVSFPKPTPEVAFVVDSNVENAAATVARLEEVQILPT